MDKARVSSALRQRMAEMGLTAGTRIVVTKRSHWNGPLEIRVRGCKLSGPPGHSIGWAAVGRHEVACDVLRLHETPALDVAPLPPSPYDLPR